MTQVTGLTAERMQEIIDETIASGEIVDGNLILHKNNGSDIDLGSVGGVSKSTFFPTVPAPEDGDLVIRIDLPGDPLYKYTDGVWELQPRMGQLTVPRARAKRSTVQSIPTATWTAIGFDTEDRDTDSMHDTVTNNTRLTAKTPGLYLVRASVSFAPNAVGSRQIDITKTTVGGTVTTEAIQEATSESTVGSYFDLTVTALVDLAAGDYVEAKAMQTSGGALNVVTSDPFSPVLEAAWVGGAGQTVDERGAPAARVKRTAAFSAGLIPNSSATAIPWDAEDFDTDNIHDLTTNTTRLTAKTPGIYQIYGVLQWPVLGSGFKELLIRKNGVDIAGDDRGNSSSAQLHSVSTEVYLAAGDYVELIAWQNSGGSATPLAATSHLAMALVATGKTVTPYALAYKSATQSIPNTTDTIVAFPAETSDNDAIHDVVTNNSRLTARTGGVYVILGWLAYDVNNTGMRDVLIKKNGTTTLSRVSQMAVSGEISQLNVIAVVELAVGDYVELQVYQNSGAARTLQSGANLSGFSITKFGGPGSLGSGLGSAQADMYTVATLPAATSFPNGRIVGVSDGAGGQQARMAMNGAWINLG